MLKKSFTIAATITAILFGVIMYIGSLYGQYAPYDTAQYSPKNLGQGSRDFGFFYHEIGTASTYIQYFGTQSVTGSGTTGYIAGSSTAFPRLEYNASTLKFNFAGAGLQNEGSDIALASSISNSANLAAALSDETGIGAVVFSSGSTQANTTFTGNSYFPGSGIWNSSGNVGIGTTTPGYKFDVVGQEVQFTGLSNTNLIMHLNRTRDWQLASRNDGAFGLYDATAADYRLFVDTSGNVGIGTTAPGSRLSVSGGTSIGANYGVAAPTNGLIVEGNVCIGTSTPGVKLVVEGTTDAAMEIRRPSGGTSHNLLDFINGSGSRWRIGNAVNNANDFEIFKNGESLGHLYLKAGGNVGIGTTTPSNILTLPIASATDPIADAWTVHCLSDYKDFGTETTEIIQAQSVDIVRNSPVSVFKRKPVVSEIEIEKGLKSQYNEQIKKMSEIDMTAYIASTGVLGNNNESMDELIDNLWNTKPDKAVLIATKVDAEKAKLLKLDKFKKNNYAIVAENAPPEAQVYDANGNLQGVSPMALIGILWANAQKQDERITLLETQIAALSARVVILEAR